MVASAELGQQCLSLAASLAAPLAAPLTGPGCSFAQDWAWMRFEEMLATRCPPGHLRREAGAWRRLAEAEAEAAEAEAAELEEKEDPWFSDDEVGASPDD